MLSSFFRQRRIRIALNNCHDPVMQKYLSNRLSSENNNKSLMAVDIETTGFNPNTDHMISIGWVKIQDNKIQASSAQHHIIKHSTGMNQSATIHGITDDDLNEGQALKSVMDHFISELHGHCVIAHNAKIESSFLNEVSIKLYSTPLIVTYHDTLKIEEKKLRQKAHVMRANDLRLMNCRERYNLPEYTAHNALSDALACAELYLAQN